MSFIKELIHRRIPHIIGSYLIAGTSLILFVDWLVNRYMLAEYYTTLCLFGVIAIIPSVIILAYFHGSPGKDEWTIIEKLAIPVNIIFIFLVLLIGHKSYWWISKEKNNAAINKDILIGKIFSNLNDIDIITDFILKYGLDNYDDVTYIKLKGISDDKLKILYDEIIYYLNRENDYPVTLVSIYDLEDIYMEKGKNLLYYDLRSEIKLLEVEVNVFNYIGVLRDSSLNNIMYENNIEYSLSTMVYELQHPIGGNNLIYLPIGRQYQLNYIDTVYAENDTTYSSNFNAGYSFETFILANEDNISTGSYGIRTTNLFYNVDDKHTLFTRLTLITLKKESWYFKLPYSLINIWSKVISSAVSDQKRSSLDNVMKIINI